MTTGEKIKQFFVRLYEKAFDEDIFSSAAQVAFYFLFALFPLLLFLVNIFGIMMGQSNELRAELFSYLHQVMPTSAYDLVAKTLEEVVEGSSGGKLTLGLLVTLYSASAGIDSLRIALNAVYKLEETRDWWKTKLRSVVLTLLLGVLIFIALGVIFYGSQFINLILGRLADAPIESPWLLQGLAVVTVIIALLAVFDVLYYFVPDHKNLVWKWITPGAIVAIVLWFLLSKGFSVYLQYFDSYAKTYGSLGAIIILMLWLYLTALVILIGGAMNAILDEFSRGQYTKKDMCEEPGAKTTDAHNAKAADPEANSPAPPEDIAENKKEGSGEKLPPSPAVDATPVAEKSKLKVAMGALIAGLIGLFSLKNKGGSSDKTK